MSVRRMASAIGVPQLEYALCTLRRSGPRVCFLRTRSPPLRLHASAFAPTMGVRVGALVALLLASFGGAAAQEAAPPLCGQVSFAAGRQQLPVSPDWLQHTRVLVNDGSGRRAVPSKAGR